MFLTFFLIQILIIPNSLDSPTTLNTTCLHVQLQSLCSRKDSLGIQEQPHLHSLNPQAPCLTNELFSTSLKTVNFWSKNTLQRLDLWKKKIGFAQPSRGHAAHTQTTLPSQPLMCSSCCEQCSPDLCRLDLCSCRCRQIS